MKSKVNDIKGNVVIVFQSPNCVRLFETPQTAAFQASPSFTISWSLLKLMSIQSVMSSKHLIFYLSLLLPSIIFPSFRVFCNESALCISGQGTGASSSASVFPMNSQGWFPLRMTDLIFLLSKTLKRVFSSTTIQKYQFFGAQPSWSNSHICTWLLEKP